MIYVAGWPQTSGKPGILRDFFKHGKLREFSGNLCNLTEKL